MKMIGNPMSYDSSEILFERAKKIIPGGVHSPVRSFKNLDKSPLFFERANGPYLYSIEGKEYIDYCLSFGPLILGHQDPDVKLAVQEMFNKAWTFGACEPYSLELAEWIIKEVPFIEKLRFVSSGTEAVMSALRVARATTGKNKIIKFEGCYHGHVDSLLVKAGSGLAGESSTSSAGVSENTASETLVCPLNNISYFEQVLEREKSNVAAVIIEPLPANYGLLVQTKDFLHQIQSLCKKHGVLFILDEVISGFRISIGGMASLYDLDPDLVCYGKIIGGGFPVGCYAGKALYMDKVAPLGNVYQAGTLSANPIGMVAGLTTLQKLKSLNIHKTLEDNTSYLSDNLNKLFADKKQPLQCIHFQSLFWIHTKTTSPIRRPDEIPNQQSARFKQLFLNCLNENVYLAPNAFEVGFMSFAHKKEHLDKTISALGRALDLCI